MLNLVAKVLICIDKMFGMPSQISNFLILTATVARNFAVILDQAFCVRNTMLILGPIIFTIIAGIAAINLSFTRPIGTCPNTSIIIVVSWQFVNTTCKMKREILALLIC